jgi:hypothetical protein
MLLTIYYTVAYGRLSNESRFAALVFEIDNTVEFIGE